uniref:DUF19 domain-containing protein n=1 Tax=Panagrellus redivivus TaxID=6233 RepID=A0A7E4ZWL7_PANRE
MGHFALVAATLVVCVGVAMGANCNAATNTCDILNLGCCDKNFRTALNFSTSLCDGGSVFADPECFRQHIEQLYIDGGIQGVITVCDSFNLFKDCLGDSIVSCLTADYYLQNGYSREVAEQTQTLYAHLQFACGAGFESFIHNENCLPSTWDANRQHINQCRDQFIANGINGHCYALTDFLDCVKLPFEQACSIEATWWMCEYSRVTAHLFFPECRGSCLVNNLSTKKLSALKQH